MCDSDLRPRLCEIVYATIATSPPERDRTFTSIAANINTGANSDDRNVASEGQQVEVNDPSSKKRETVPYQSPDA